MTEYIYGSDFQEILYFGRYRDDCIGVWHGTTERLDEFFQFINMLSLDLKFTMEVGGNSLYMFPGFENHSC